MRPLLLQSPGTGPYPVGNALANTIDPETWPTTLDPVLFPVLLALYPVPPHRGPAPAPSDYRRLADVIESWAVIESWTIHLPQVSPQCMGRPQATLERAVLRHIRVKKRLPCRAPPLPV